jgi:hypothetical protein
MRNLKKVVNAVAAAAAPILLFGAAATPAAAAEAAPTAALATCYGGAQTFVKLEGGYYSTSYYTSNRCSDINVKSNQATFLRVCFAKIDLYTCQADYTYVVPGQWKTVATNVLDNRKFIFEFYNDAHYNGLLAA